jgi:hypothetical protein
MKLMDFFNDLGKTLSNVAKQVEEKSGELLEAGRLNIEIFKEEDAIRKTYRKIGELIFKEFDKGEPYAGKADDLCDQIRQRKRKIELLKAKLSETKVEAKPAEHMNGEQHSNSEKEMTEGAPVGPEVYYFEAAEEINNANYNSSAD